MGVNSFFGFLQILSIIFKNCANSRVMNIHYLRYIAVITHVSFSRNNKLAEKFTISSVFSPQNCTLDCHAARENDTCVITAIYDK
jgi:hypothetical protein